MQRGSWRRRAAALAVGLLAAATAACSGDDSSGGGGDDGSADGAPASSVAAGVTTTQPASTTTPAEPATTVSTAPLAPVASSTGPVTTAPVVTSDAPGAEWDTIDAEAAGIDAAALDRLGAQADAAGSSCTAIVRGGKLVDSRAWGSTAPREAWSVTKSVTSTLIGIAQDQGLLTVDDRVSTYVPEWKGTPSENVTIRDILSNASGRQWDADTDYVQMAFAADDKTAFAIALGQDAEPGEIWAYNNSAIQVLEQVLEIATGESPVDYAERVLFDPIGMTSTHLTTDDAGNALTYAGMRSTCGDLARFGYLMLHDGEWNGTQIVSAEYVARATGEPSTELNAAYGWLWWLNHRGPIGSALIATSGPGDGSVVEGQMLPDHSTDTFWALGLFDQIVAVIPTEDIVAVRMGDEPPAAAPFGVAQFTSAVLDTVVEHGPS